MPSVEDVAWDLEPLVHGRGRDGVTHLLQEAAEIAAEIAASTRGQVATLDAGRLAAVMTQLAKVHELVGRAGSYAMLAYSVNTLDTEAGALLQRVQEDSTAIMTELIFFDLEWAALDDGAVAALLDDERLEFCAHHLRSTRRYRPHLLSEAEERLDAEKDVTGRNAWVRLFSELTSAISVDLPDQGTVSLEQGLSLLQSPDGETRRTAAEAVTAALRPGLRTRAYVFNTLLADKATDDRIRKYSSWVSSRNLANEASDDSVEALVNAVQSRYDIAQRWYRLKAKILGLQRLADYDRMASVVEGDVHFEWDDARDLVLDAYRSFSPELADTAQKFFDGSWIDAPVRPGKRPGAFCSYTVPSHHPYLMLNWTSRRRDVLTLAHEMGHGLHAYLARGQGVFHQSTPLTLAETASVFGETVTFGRLLERTTDPADRLGLLAESIEGSIATVFRQVAMNRFEHAVHTSRRDEGELSVERFGELWAQTQHDMLGDSVEVTEGYRAWWSYIPHFIGTPGYVYAYAYGQLLALSVYRRYQEVGADFVPRYLGMLAAGGSLAPEELGRRVDCDLADPTFWHGGLAIVDDQLAQAETAAREAGRLG